MNVAGAGVEFGGLPRSNTLKVLGGELMSIGRFECADASFRLIEGDEGGRYYRFVFHDGRLAGAILLGDASAGGAVKKAIETGADFSGLLAAHPAATDVVAYLSRT